MRIIRIRHFFALFLALAVSAVAQVIPDRYLVELRTEPVLEMRARNRQNVTREQVAERRLAIASEQNRAAGAVAGEGGRVLHSMDTAANLLSVRISAAGAARLASISGVRAVHPVYRVHADLDRAQTIHKVVEAWQTIGGRDHAGDGIKIAILDSGIDPDHPGFKGSSLTPPEGFPKFRLDGDQQVVNNKIIVARSYDDLYDGEPESARDCYGHGTGVAMSAAGQPVRANYAQVSGMAPQAFLGAYRVFKGCTGGGATDVVLRAINDAINDGMDVINLSLGSDIYSRRMDTIYNTVFQRAAAAGIVVVASAGNSGPEAVTVGAPGNSTEVISVGATHNSRTFAFPVVVGNLGTVYGQTGSGPNTPDAISGVLFDIASIDPTGLGCDPFPDGSMAGKIALIRRGICTFEDKINNAERAGARAVLMANNVISSRLITMPVGAAKLPAMMVSRSDGAAIRAALVTSPELTVSLGFNGETVEDDSQRIASFSSRGPSLTGDYALKPDLVAVGANLYTGASTNPSATIYDGSGFKLASGTSYSAPVVTGTVALLRQARPGLTAPQYRSLIVNSASPFAPLTGTEFAPVEAGAGILNLDAALKAPLALSTTTLSFGSIEGTFDLTREVTVYNLSGADEAVSIEAAAAQSGVTPTFSDATLAIPAGGSAKFTVRMQGTEIPGGAYQGIIRLRSTVSAAELRLPYWMARPTGIPQTLTILDVDPATPSPGEEVEVGFRIVDTSGLPINGAGVIVTPITTGLEVLSTENIDADVPGLWMVKMKLAPLSPNNRFMIQLGDFARQYSIPAQ